MQRSIQQEVDELTFGLVDCLTAEELAERLSECREKGRPFRLKYGADPSAPDIHLGHSVPLRKMRAFQELGHRVDFVIGDFTGMIGDPTGRSKTRPPLSKEEVAANARTYEEQVFKILDPELTDIRFNADWNDVLSFSDVIRLAATYTVAGMLERNDYRRRFEAEKPIYIHEFLYPLAQAYDSVHLESDAEIGGTDQLFNFVTTREIMKRHGLRPEIVLTVPLLEGTDGVEKMSKSLGNYIGINEAPEQIYGKTMSIPDELIVRYYTLCTDVAAAEVRRLEADMAAGELNPRDAKARLARELVRLYHGDDAVTGAEEHFNTVVRRKELPDEIAVYTVKPDENWICAVIKDIGFAKSNGEARRLIKQGAVRLDGEKVGDVDLELTADKHGGQVFQVGKRRFRRLVFP
ncbi:MAG: tyrosine--tRNA ligase [Candidatus Coatesbacteria bacterium]|nr:tyrosine--tRNA ligase [Candidatus Coatesbacteria bacterium]